MSSKGDSVGVLRSSGRAKNVDAAVLANVEALGPVCREALCRASGLRESTACGALDRLMKKGLVVEAEERVWNVATRRNVKAYSVPKPIEGEDDVSE